MKNPYSIMSHCDTLVLFSKYEGTPVTIDEAMVLGVGIVAPRIGGIAEQVNGYEKVKFTYCEINQWKNKAMENNDRGKGVDYKVKNEKIQLLIRNVL